MAKIEFQIPRMVGKGKRATVEHVTKRGAVAFFDVAGQRVKFVLQADNEGDATELTHYASGFVFGRLNPVKVSHMVAYGSYVKLSDRGAAEILIARAVASMGGEKVLATLNAAPVINA